VRLRSSKVILAAAAVTTTLAVAGCSFPSTPGTPEPQGSGSGSATTGPSSLPAGTPHVANPLDASKGQAAPCSLLAQPQITSLGIVARGKLSDATLGPSCSWSDTSTIPSKMSFTVQFVTANTSGLSSLYGQKDSLRKGGYFEPIDPIQDYPAVLYSPYEAYSRRAN
jgi:Protein of unknown function (DUF3558)